MSSNDKMRRTVLPIPDPQHVGLTTYDAKDPDTKYPPNGKSQERSEVKKTE